MASKLRIFFAIAVDLFQRNLVCRIRDSGPLNSIRINYVDLDLSYGKVKLSHIGFEFDIVCFLVLDGDVPRRVFMVN